MLYDLAKENGILDNLVKHFKAQIYFDCYIFAPKGNPNYSFPFVFYNTTLDFLKRLNAYVCIWPCK